HCLTHAYAVPECRPFSAGFLPAGVLCAAVAQDCCDVVHPRRPDALLLAPLLARGLDVARVAVHALGEVAVVVAEPATDVLGLAVRARCGEHRGGRVESVTLEPDGAVDDPAQDAGGLGLQLGRQVLVAFVGCDGDLPRHQAQPAPHTLVA